MWRDRHTTSTLRKVSFTRSWGRGEEQGSINGTFVMSDQAEQSDAQGPYNWAHSPQYRQRERQTHAYDGEADMHENISKSSQNRESRHWKVPRSELSGPDNNSFVSCNRPRPKSVQYTRVDVSQDVSNGQTRLPADVWYNLGKKLPQSNRLQTAFRKRVKSNNETFFRSASVDNSNPSESSKTSEESGTAPIEQSGANNSSGREDGATTKTVVHENVSNVEGNEEEQAGYDEAEVATIEKAIAQNISISSAKIGFSRSSQHFSKESKLVASNEQSARRYEGKRSPVCEARRQIEIIFQSPPTTAEESRSNDLGTSSSGNIEENTRNSGPKRIRNELHFMIEGDLTAIQRCDEEKEMSLRRVQFLRSIAFHGIEDPVTVISDEESVEE